MIAVTFVYSLILAYVVGYEYGFHSQEEVIKQLSYEAYGIVLDGALWYLPLLPFILVGFVLAICAIILLKRKRS